MTPKVRSFAALLAATLTILHAPPYGRRNASHKATAMTSSLQLPTDPQISPTERKSPTCAASPIP